MSLSAAADRPVPRSPDEWLDRLRSSVQRLDSALWEIGDLMQAAPEGLTGTEISARTGGSIGMLRTAKWLAGRFSAAERRAELGPSHHLEVAGLPDAAATPLLERAAAEGWTVIRLRSEARAARIGAAPPKRAPEPASADWTTEARRAERDLRTLAMEIVARLRSADEIVAALAAHPGRGGVHGNRHNSVVEHFRAVFDALAGQMREFLARSHLDPLEAT